MVYKPGMDLTEYFERYNYFPKLTDFIFGELAYAIRYRGFLEKEDFVLIWLWKTQLWQIDEERGTFKHEQKEDYFETDEQEIKNITKRIFEIDHSNRDSVAKLIGDLDTLRGVGTKVATAILSVVFPDKYGIVDVHVQRALGIKDIQIPEYVRTEAEILDYQCTEHIFKMREIAKEQTRITGRYWTPRMVDMALWVMDQQEHGY